MTMMKLLFRVIVLASIIRGVDGLPTYTEPEEVDEAEATTFDDLIEEEIHPHHHRDEEVFAMGRPDFFAGYKGKIVPCHENGVVASWCDTHLDPNVLECGLLPEFDVYGCSCVGDASLCPDECVNGEKPEQRTKHGISCSGIPEDEPNYILKEMRSKRSTMHCENNAVVAGWCDDYVNPHLECRLMVAVDQYQCKCPHKVAACPSECVEGTELVEKSHGVIKCKGIPIDQPNYIIKEE